MDDDHSINESIEVLDNLLTRSVVHLSYSITLPSTIINIFGFYMLLTQTRKDGYLYRNVLLFSQISLYISQTFWAFGVCIVPIFPFPAVVSQGLFHHEIENGTLLFIWGILFGIFIISLLSVPVVRLRIVVRKNSLLDFSILTLSIIGLFFLTTIILCFSLLQHFVHSSTDDTIIFVYDNYPTYYELLEVHEITIFPKISVLKVAFVFSLGFVFLIVFLYIGISYGIYFEIKKQSRKISKSVQKYHKKVIKDTFIQILSKIFSIIAFPVWCFAWYLFQFNTHAKELTNLTHTIFVASPIPGTLIMISQTPAYCRYIKRKLKIKQETTTTNSTIVR